MATQSYVLNGPVSFVFPFPVRTASQLTLEVSPSGGVVPPSDYSVFGAGPNATQVTVQWLTAPTDGAQSVIVSRYVQPDRLTDFSVSEVTDTALDTEYDNIYLVLNDQQDVASRALKYPIGGVDYDALSKKIENLGAPVLDADASTKKYVDDTFAPVAAAAAAAAASATAAQTAEANAETAETNAETAATNAAASATAADTSEAAAAASAASADTSEAAAAASAASADTSEAAAETAETNAETAATNAAASATAADTSEANAAASATAADTAEAAAASSATAAQTAETNAEAALDEFTDIYLGAKASNPTTDNDGNALKNGALYYNPASGLLIYDLANTDWLAYSPVSVASIFGRSGIVVAQAGDYTAAQITETAAKKILTSTERTKLAGIETGAEVNDVDTVFGRVGAVAAQTGDYSASQVTNDSGVAGTNVDDALDALAAATPDVPVYPRAALLQVTGELISVASLLQSTSGTSLSDANCLAIHPETGDAFVLSGGDNTVYQYNGIPTGAGTNAVAQFPVDSGALGLAFDRVGNLVTIEASASTAYVYSTSGTLLDTVGGLSPGIECFTVDEDGNLAVCVNGTILVYDKISDTALRSFAGLFFSTESMCVVGGTLISKAFTTTQHTNYYTGEDAAPGTVDNFTSSSVGFCFYGNRVYVGNQTLGNIDYVNAAAIVPVSRFESPELSITNTTNYSQSHGLGQTPWHVQAILRCKTSQLGYFAGNEVPIDMGVVDNSSTFGVGVKATPLFVEAVIGEAITIARKGSPVGTPAAITNANWRLVLRAQL